MIGILNTFSLLMIWQAQHSMYDTQRERAWRFWLPWQSYDDAFHKRQFLFMGLITIFAILMYDLDTHVG